jgi:hypothetical protein
VGTWPTSVAEATAVTRSTVSSSFRSHDDGGRRERAHRWGLEQRGLGGAAREVGESIGVVTSRLPEGSLLRVKSLGVVFRGERVIFCSC